MCERLLTARARLLKVARTIAGLDQSDRVLAEAIQYRSPVWSYWV